MPFIILRTTSQIALSKTGSLVPLGPSAPIPLFLISGDPFLRTEKVKTIVRQLEKTGGAPVAGQIFDLKEKALEEILSSARTLPLFSSSQVFHIQNAASLKEPDIEVLAAYLERPAPQTTLIFEADDLKGASELQQLVKSKGQLISLAKAEARGTGPTFLQQKLAQYQKTMTPGAKARVLAMCGDAVMFLNTMIERLAQFADDRPEIDEAMVLRFEENWEEMDVFKLTNALVDRDPARALKVFRDLTEIHEADIYSLVGILHWQLRQLWQAAMLLRAGTPEREICSKLKMQPARLGALRRFPIERLEAAVEHLYQFDKKSKTGQADGIAGMESWLLQYAA